MFPLLLIIESFYGLNQVQITQDKISVYKEITDSRTSCFGNAFLKC